MSLNDPAFECTKKKDGMVNSKSKWFAHISCKNKEREKGKVKRGQVTYASKKGKSILKVYF